MGEEATNELFGLVRELKADIAVQTAILRRVDDELKDKEKRIRELELESAKNRGIMAVVGVIGGAIGTVAVWIAKHFFGGDN